MYNQRYQVPQLPTCTQCHSSIQTSNSYHSVHFTSLSCQTCHSQNYNNCGSCHVGGAGARVPAYLGYKIGVNPIPQSRPYRLGVLRRALSAPDSWQNYGVPLLANFAARPTYKYATPHNIQRWTTRTQVLSGRACYDNCHIISEGGAYRNRELYLFRSDLLPWEVDANAGVVVDGRLPASWGTP
jgi:thiosulfate/3-mercaptopyruvate sulfurtransferase